MNKCTPENGVAKHTSSTDLLMYSLEMVKNLEYSKTCARKDSCWKLLDIAQPSK